MSKRTTIILPESLYAKLSHVASLEDKMASEVIRDAIRFYLDECEDYDSLDWDNIDLGDIPAELDLEPEPTCAECGEVLTHGYQVLEDGTALCNQCQLKLDKLAEVRELAETKLPKHDVGDLPPPDD